MNVNYPAKVNTRIATYRQTKENDKKPAIGKPMLLPPDSYGLGPTISEGLSSRG